MSPSASFGETDGSAGYEPTMSPGAFQAAMAAGILAAQGLPAAAPKHSTNQSDDTAQRIASVANDGHSAEVPMPSTVRKGNEPLNEPLTPSSVASNSAVSLPVFKPDLSAGLADSSTAPQAAAAATPVSKQTGTVDSAVSPAAADGGAEDPASPAAGMSTNAAASSASAGPRTYKVSVAEDQADSTGAIERSPIRVVPGPAQLPDASTSASFNETAPSPASDSHKAADSQPASTQLAEIADASSQADALSTAVQPTADDAESAPQPAVSQSVRLADSHSTPESVNTAAASSKGLFSAVSKRPAEVRCQPRVCQVMQHAEYSMLLRKTSHVAMMSCLSCIFNSAFMPYGAQTSRLIDCQRPVQSFSIWTHHIPEN